MADIELVIKIPEEAKQAFDYAESNDLKGSYYDHGGVIGNAIKNGTPLPKEHGRLIDEKDLSLMTVHLIDGMFVCDAPTIIEADRLESEGKE